MKKIISVAGFSGLLLLTAGCLKSGSSTSCKDKTVASEESLILSYASTNNITATKHSSGLYYQVITPGSGATPNGGSLIFVRYTGKLLNGTVFDSQTNASATGWRLSGLVEGWQLGLPLIQKGGSIKLIVPSSLAYGCDGRGPIPPDAILYFEIDLVDVQ